MSRLSVHLWSPGLVGFSGGIGRFSRELALALRASGNNVELLGKGDRKGAWEGMVVRGSERWPAAFRTPMFAVLLLFRCLVACPDVIVSTHPNFGPVARLARRLFGVRYVLVAHGIDVGPALSNMRILALREADGVWVVSRWTRGRVEALGVAAHKISIIPNTLSDAEFSASAGASPLASRYAIGEGEKVILTVARLDGREGYKGYDLVIESLPEVIRAIGAVRYLIVGGGSDANRIQVLAQSLGVGDRVTLCGFVPDEALADHYRLADVFAMPSRGEGFGIVFLEAMASGVPVMGGNQDGTVDALDDGKLGLLVDPISRDAIAVGLISLLGRKGPELWFDPSRLRDACLARFGRTSFRESVDRAVERLQHQRENT